jgi:hypothetical protein
MRKGAARVKLLLKVGPPSSLNCSRGWSDFMRSARLLVTGALLLLEGCSYLHFASVHASYEKSYATQPTLWVQKHSLRQPTYFVYGRLLSTQVEATDEPALAVAALSSRYRKDEIADINSLGQAQTYYGLNLPPGKYRLVALADLNRDGRFGRDEVVGERPLDLTSGAVTDGVAGGIDIAITRQPVTRLPPTFRSPAAPVRTSSVRPSLFYPRGALRSLDDPLFSRKMAQLGLYDPAAFVEAAPTMFYALEEDVGHKVPVIFVHGIGGSPAEFRYLVQSLDPTRYKAWFYYYPSGSDLAQLAQLFHDIFLSGTVIPQNEMPVVVVAHSMGGLVVREALNRCAPAGCGNRVARFITIASPFGGEPAARLGVRHASIVPPA